MDENFNQNNNVQPPAPEQNMPSAPPVPEQQPAAEGQQYAQIPAQPVQPTAQPQTEPVYQQPSAPQQGAPYQQQADNQQTAAYQQGMPYQQNAQPYQSYQVMPAPPKKPVNKKLLIGIIAAAVVVLAAFITGAVLLISALTTTTVDMSKYYQIEVNGFNGYAKADIFEIVDPFEDLSEQGKLKDQNSLSSNLSYYAFFSDLDGELSKSENISNGDTVELEITYNKEIAKRLKLRIKNATIKLKVSGLEEGKKVDPFQELELEFTGISPNGRVSINNNSSHELIRKIRYSADKTSKLKNGDTIVVTASYDEEYALENGYIIENDTKEYTVSGLDYYLSDQTEISAAQKTDFEKEFKDRIESILASRADSIYNKFGESVYGGETPSVGTPQLVKGYLLSAKDEDKYYSDYNKIVMIYKVEIEVKAGKYSSSPEKFGKRTGYVAVQFSDAGIGKDGIFIDTPTSTYSGYEAAAAIDTLENDYITANKSNYIVSEWK